MERMPTRHSRECPSAIRDRKHFVTVIPMEADHCSGAALVGIAVSAVLIKDEVGILPAIDSNFQGVLRLCCRLHHGPHWNDAACHPEYGNPIQWSIGRSRLASLIA